MQRPRVANAAMGLLAATLASGCDIVGGFQSASDAVFPQEKNYLDAPGYRIASGGFRGLEFAAGTDLYLLARSADTKDDSLYAMLYGDPKPCTIPKVKSQWVSDGSVKGPAFIAYFEEDPPGTLRFADGNCHIYELTVPNAWLPYTQLPQGFIVQSGSDVVLADPAAGTMRTLVSSIENVYFYASSDTSFVLVGGRLGAFGPDWTAGGWFGDGVKSVAGAGNSLFVEDNTGIHRLTSTGGSSPMVTDTMIVSDGCTLGNALGIGAAESWVTFYSPCADKKLVVYGAGASRKSELDLPADPRHVALMPDYPNVDGDPTKDPFYFFYLTDVDAGTDRGTMVVRTPDKREITLGMNAAFERLTFVPASTGTHGYALVDVSLQGTGRYVRWQPDGAVEELSQNTVRGRGDILVNWDGQVGDLALPDAQALTVVTRRVPPWHYKFRDSKNRWTGLLHDVDGAVGSLSFTTSSLDFNEAIHAPSPIAPVQPLADRVVLDGRTDFLTSIPGLAWLADYDSERDIGRLDYRNLELEFSATVSENVCTYVATPDGMIYSVPFGDNAGIWAVRAR